MARAVVDEETFIGLVEKLGYAAAAREIGVNERGVYSRVARIEKRLGIRLFIPTARLERRSPNKDVRREVTVENGSVVIGSDAHYWWPHDISTAHAALVHVVKETQPSVVILNGDVIDGASISRHPPLGWGVQPTVVQELEAAQLRLKEIEEAAPKGTTLLWNMGNHDLRFERALLTHLEVFRGVKGTALQDHFPKWKIGWSVAINWDKSHPVMVKHRFKGGDNAAFNNTLKSGVSMVTGHLHKGEVRPFTDYRGTRYGVDAGTMAEPEGLQFEYTEDNPKNWRSGFCVLTFDDYLLLPPELVMVRDFREGEVMFRGEIVRVSLPDPVSIH